MPDLYPYFTTQARAAALNPEIIAITVTIPIIKGSIHPEWFPDPEPEFEKESCALRGFLELDEESPGSLLDDDCDSDLLPCESPESRLDKPDDSALLPILSPYLPVSPISLINRSIKLFPSPHVSI